jgi:hypothetical protein
MKLDILTKQRIDKWFSEVTADELLYITKKYLTQDQSLQLIQPVVARRSEQLICKCQERTFYEWEKSDNKCAECLRQLYIN